jgi:hypothetical protein
MLKSDAWLFFKDGSNDSAVCKLCSVEVYLKKKQHFNFMVEQVIYRDI